jgi:hypothetical protein
MPVEDKKKKVDPMVDIDTSGPGAEVELKTKQPEQEKEYETSTDDNKSTDTSAQSNEQPAVETKKESEIKDQGTEENVPANDQKKELDDYSEGVQKRIAKLTKKMREAERQREAALEYARKVHAEKETLTGRLNKLDTGYVTEMENRIKSSMEAAASRLGQARLDGDLKAEIAAQTEIARLGYEEARLAEIKSKQALEVKVDNSKPVQDYVERLREQPVQQEQNINPDPRAQDWASRNSWFGKDEPMTYTAFSLHKKLVEDEGYDPQSNEYYAEIDKRIRLEFPHKFATTGSQTTENAKPAQTVASASRPGRTSSGRKTVKLTSSQVAIAKKLGVPLEEYAKHLTTKEV